MFRFFSNLILNLKYSFLTVRKSVAKGANWREQKKKKKYLRFYPFPPFPLWGSACCCFFRGRGGGRGIWFSREQEGRGKKNRLTLRFRRFRRVAGDLISHAGCEVISLHLICCFRPNAGLALLRSLNRTRAHATPPAFACTQNTFPPSNQHLSSPPPLLSMSPSIVRINDFYY